MGLRDLVAKYSEKQPPRKLGLRQLVALKESLPEPVGGLVQATPPTGILPLDIAKMAKLFFGPTGQAIGSGVSATGEKVAQRVAPEAKLPTRITDGTKIPRLSPAKEGAKSLARTTIKEGFDLLRPETIPLVLAGFGQARGLRALARNKILAQAEAEFLSTPAGKITQALKEAKPLRGKQAQLFHEIRSEQAKKLIATGERIPGEKGFHAQLSQLKGDLPKVQFESIRNKISQDDVDTLFNQIEGFTTMAPFEKINAKIGLSKLLGGEGGIVPTRSELRLLAQIFPNQFIKTALSKRDVLQKISDKFVDIINLPKAVKASTDLSAPLRQGVFFIGRPKQFLPAFTKMFKQFFSERAYRGLQKDIQMRPTFELMSKHKLELTDVLTTQEEAFLSQMAEKLPAYGKVVRASNRAYTGFLNKLRADVFDDLTSKATQIGYQPNANPEVFDHIANFINNATGRGKLPGALEGSAALLNGALFSPRLLASRLNLLNPMFYVNQHPFVRKEALKSLLTFAGTGMSVLSLAHLGGAEVGIDPRSTDFGKMKFGNARYDIWGGFQQYLVAASRLYTGEQVSSTTGREIVLGEGYKPTTRADIVARFLRGKLAPVPAFAMNLLEGQTFQGQKIRPPVEVANLFIPMVLDDLYDLSQERGNQGIFMSIPAFFGVGIQNYGDVIPIAEKTPSGATTIKFRQPPQLAETIVNKLTGTQASTVPPELRPGLVRERFIDLKRKTEIERTKRLVLEDGRPRQVGTTIVFLKNGVVKSKNLARTPSLKSRVERQMGNVSFTSNNRLTGLRALVRKYTDEKTP